MTMHTKKIVATVAVAVFALLGTAAPADAAKVENANHWCC